MMISPVPGSCSVSRVTHLIGEKWSYIVLEQVALHDGEGFNALMKRLKKIRPKILSQRLKHLEQEDLLEKRVSSQKRPYRSSYHLTAKGAAFLELIQKMKEWHDRFVDDGVRCAGKECPHCSLY